MIAGRGALRVDVPGRATALVADLRTQTVGRTHSPAFDNAKAYRRPVFLSCANRHIAASVTGVVESISFPSLGVDSTALGISQREKRCGSPNGR